jgi:ABC-type polysaccharide/polyol phosphate transport system ATPase subunit
MILVSHAPATVEALCSRVIWLDHGRIAADGPTATVLPAFVASAKGHVTATEDGRERATRSPRDLAAREAS